MTPHYDLHEHGPVWMKKSTNSSGSCGNPVREEIEGQLDAGEDVFEHRDDL